MIGSLKGIIGLSCVCLLIVTMSGCGNQVDETPPVVTTEQKATEAEGVVKRTETETEQEEVELELEELPDYREIYLELIDQLYSSDKADLFALVNIDGDEVPELAASSTDGSWEKDQEYLYMIYNEAPVLLISDIAPGLDGNGIGFFEGKNVIERRGTATGSSETFYEVNEGQLNPIFTMQQYDLDGNHYLINDVEVGADEFMTEAGSFFENIDTVIELGTSEMTVSKINPDFEFVYFGFDIVGTRPYITYSQIKNELGGITEASSRKTNY